MSEQATPAQQPESAAPVGKPIEATDQNFQQEVLNSPIPVLIDFWAPWCGPCKMIAPAVEELAKEHAGKLKVMKMNIDDNMQTPRQFYVRGIPTLLLFKGGQVVEQIVGAVPKSQMQNAIAKHVSV